MSIEPEYMGFEALPQTSDGSNLAINSRSRFTLATWVLHELDSQPTQPSVEGLISHRIGHAVRVGAPERAHACKALKPVCTVDVRTQKPQYYVLGALRFLHFGSSCYLTSL